MPEQHVKCPACGHTWIGGFAHGDKHRECTKCKCAWEVGKERKPRGSRKEAAVAVAAQNKESAVYRGACTPRKRKNKKLRKGGKSNRLCLEALKKAHRWLRKRKSKM